MKRRKVEFQKTILFLRIHLRRIFFVSFLLFLLSQKKKQEKPDGKRKKKKGFLGHAYRLIKFPCVKRGEFYLLSCVTCGHSTSANSAGPNHSLRIRWFEERAGGDRSSVSYPVGVGASTTRKNERVWNASHQVTNKRPQCRGDHRSSVKTNDFI